MNVLEEATAALRTAEHQLRSILVHAVEEGDYDHLPRIAEWAKLLGATLSGQPVTELVPIRLEVIPPVSSNNGIHERRAVARAGSLVLATRKPKAKRRKKLLRRKTVNAAYPQFVREGESLVKIGWSKSEGKTYEHKAPRGVLRGLVQALIRVGSGGNRFTVEGLLPIKDAGSDVPDYQSYLTLAWLRSAGLITQHGRQGYSLPAGANLKLDSERHWGELQTR